MHLSIHVHDDDGNWERERERERDRVVNVPKAASMSGNDRDSFFVLSKSTAALPRPRRRVRRTSMRQPNEIMTSLWLTILLIKPDSTATGGMP